MAEDSIRAQWVLGGARAEEMAAVYAVDGRRCRTKAEMLAHWAERLLFPDYFGRNWDAFEECLGDFCERRSSEASAVVVRIEHAADLLTDDSDADLLTLVDIVRSVTDQATAAGRPRVTVEMIDEPRRLADLRDRLAASRHDEPGV